MKYILAILLFTCSSPLLFGQELAYKKPGTGKSTLKDSIDVLVKQAEAHSLPGTIHCHALFIAGKTILNSSDVEVDPVSNYTVIQPIASFKKYGYLGIHGTVEVKTKQNFDPISLQQIRQQRYAKLEGKIIYAINGIFVKDTGIAIPSAALLETELIKIGENPLLSSEYFNATCISCWTMTKAERANPASFCPRQLVGCYLADAGDDDMQQYPILHK